MRRGMVCGSENLTVMDGSSGGTQRELDIGEVETAVAGAREIAFAHRALDLPDHSKPEMSTQPMFQVGFWAPRISLVPQGKNLACWQFTPDVVTCFTEPSFRLNR